MSDKRIEVEFGAKTAEIESGAKTAADAVEKFSGKAEQGASKASSSWGKLGPIFGDVSRAAQENLAGSGASALGSFGDAARNSAQQAAQHWESLPPVFRGVAAAATGALMAIGAALAVKAVADANAEMVESTMDLARALGIATNEASVLRAALDDVGASQDEFLGAAKGLSRQLGENEGDLKKMGLVTRDAAGELRPLNDLTLDAIELLKTYREGTDRAIAGREIFGRGIESSSRLMLLNSDTIESNRQAVAELNLMVGESATQAWADYDSAADRAGLTMKAFGKAVGESVMPVATELTEWFNNIAPAAITVVRGALAGLGTAFVSITNGVRVLWETLNALIVTLAEPLRAFIEAVMRMATGDFRGAFEAVKGIGPTISSAWATAMENMEASSLKTSDRIKTMWAFATGGNDTPGNSGAVAGTKGAPPPKPKSGPAEPKEKQADSYLQTYQAVLEGIKNRYAMEHDLREMGKAEEIAYWREILDTYQVTSKDQGAIALRMQRLELDLAKESAATQKQLKRDKVAHDAEMSLASVDLDQQAAQLSLDLGKTTKDEMLALEEQFEVRRNAIRLNALLEQQAAVDPTRDPVAYAQITAQIELLEAQHQQNLAGIRGQAAIESGRTMTGIGQSLESGFSGVFAKIGTSITSIGGLMRGMGQAVLQTFTQMLAQMAAKWLVNKLVMKGISKAAAIGQLGEEAAKAGAGGVASMAAAPFPLNLGAPAFGASMSALAMSFAPLASAAGGYDIPAGVNPLVQTHAKEMILPAKYADVIRGMADGRGDSDEGEGGGKVVKFYGTPDDTVRASQLPDMLRELGANFEFVRGFNR